jgi:hypothetical protein
MTITTSAREQRFEEVLNRLTEMSERDYYNPYQLFSWPDELPTDRYWMSPELMSIHGTALDAELTEEQRWAFSRWESINFYSLNVHGIRELLTEIIARIHTAGFERPSEYFHHLIGEENEHMWFFATFCLKYGKIYPDKSLRIPMPQDPRIGNFLVFSRLLIFEEIVDFFNKRMGTDERLHPTIQQVNAIHHQDESRHIAFGRQVVALLHHQLRADLPPDGLAELERHLKTYMQASVDSLCNPTVFADAGIPNPYQARRRVLEDPAHHEMQNNILKRTVSFMVNEGIFSDGVIGAS